MAPVGTGVAMVRGMVATQRPTRKARIMADGITQVEYWTEIEALAKSVTEAAREHDTDIHDVLHETIDGHQWVIYTHFHRDVLLHSPNDTAVFDEGLVPESITCWSDLTMIGAYCALLADVRDHEAFDAGRDADDDDESEVK